MGSKMMQVKEPGSKDFPDSDYISPQCGLKGLFHRGLISVIEVVAGVALAGNAIYAKEFRSYD
ncbi:hypothetical protein [Lacrimispora indolis]|uniref:hypothetical protein n=1 Tax=Lacrimispora indolis TaxID=69825 RepID=UPI00045EBA12|nr:hypothetical protein [Lacrimispora indolis]